MLTESKSVFQKRCDELLVNLKNDLSNTGIETFSQMAFAIGTPQVPPSATDMSDSCTSIRAGATLGEAAAIKRLHFEGVTLVMAELKQVASNDVTEPSKRLPFLEKQHFLAAQKNRIVGLSHKGEQLPSPAVREWWMQQAALGMATSSKSPATSSTAPAAPATSSKAAAAPWTSSKAPPAVLIDAAYSIVESGALVYLPPSKCGSRDMEIQYDSTLSGINCPLITTDGAAKQKGSAII